MYMSQAPIYQNMNNAPVNNPVASAPAGAPGGQGGPPPTGEEAADAKSDTDDVMDQFYKQYIQ